MQMLFRFRLLLAAGLPALLLACCSSGDGINHGGSVSGKVTIDNEPVTAGNVLFVTEDGRLSAIGRLRGDGTYTAPEPPLGPVRIAVQTETFRNRPAMQPTPGPRSGDGGVQGASRGIEPPDPKEIGIIYKEIPGKYEKPETSGLTYTVKKGNQEHNIPLTWGKK